MDKRKIIIFAIVAVVLLACVVGVVWLVVQSGDAPDVAEATSSTNPENPGTTTDSMGSSPPGETTAPIQPEESTDSTKPTAPPVPTNPTTSTDSVKPTNPAEPTKPMEPAEPNQPDVPVENPNQQWKAEILVTCADGSAAQGAAVIATYSSGRQAYASTNENGVAVLNLPEGKYSVQVSLDGQHGNAEIEISNKPAQIGVQLKDNRVLYILLKASGDYTGNPTALADFSTIEESVRSHYPNAVYITSENRHEVTFHDGDALLTVEVLVEKYKADDQYFASKVCASFTAYQRAITVWDMGEDGVELETEFLDGNVCSVQVRNDYDYEYKNAVSVVSESYYAVQSDWHLSKYSNWADAWGCGYTMQSVMSTSDEQQKKASGAGKELETFWYEMNATRFSHYLTYMEQIFPYVDLWMSGQWNEGIEQVISEQ